jgi:hypothetical protein
MPERMRKKSEPVPFRGLGPGYAVQGPALEVSPMDVILSPEKFEFHECDLLVTGFFENERPLKGSAGWMDWRFNGMLSRFLIEGRLTGGWKEATLIPSRGRVEPRMILFVGLGNVREYSTIRIRELSAYLLETLNKLNVSNVCFSFPYGDSYNVDCGKLAEVLMEGIADCSDEEPSHQEWLKKLRLVFAEGENRFSELLLGVQTAQSILEDRFPIRIFAPSEERPE